MKPTRLVAVLVVAKAFSISAVTRWQQWQARRPQAEKIFCPYTRTYLGKSNPIRQVGRPFAPTGLPKI